MYRSHVHVSVHVLHCVDVMYARYIKTIRNMDKLLFCLAQSMVATLPMRAYWVANPANILLTDAMSYLTQREVLNEDWGTCRPWGDLRTGCSPKVAWQGVKKLFQSKLNRAYETIKDFQLLQESVVLRRLWCCSPYTL